MEMGEYSFFLLLKIPYAHCNKKKFRQLKICI